MGAYSRGGRLFEGGASSIISPQGWVLIRGGGTYLRGVLVRGITVVICGQNNLRV